MSSGFDNTTYYGLSAFWFVDASGTPIPVRWSMVPVQPFVPADTEAAQIVELMKERGVLLSTDGPAHNVIKIKPPLVFSRRDVDELVSKLDLVMKESVPSA